MAQVETDHADQVEFENLARAYLRFAEHAERNSQAIVYETRRKEDRDQGLEPATRAIGKKLDN